MERTQRLKKKVKESESKVKLEKSQRKKEKCEMCLPKVKMMKSVLFVLSVCGFVYLNEGDVWVCCDSCEAWYNLKSTGYARGEDIPDLYYCFKCL